MAKVVGLYSKRADMSPEAFFKRYEHGHVPLVMEVFPTAFAAYTRSYPRAEPELRALAIRPEALGFDALTQIWFAGEDGATGGGMADPVNAARLAEDEAALFDRGALLSFATDERGAAPAGADALLKLVALYDRAEGVVAEDFVRHAEDSLAGTTPLVAASRRNYLISGGVFEHPSYETARQSPPDLVLELWTRSAADVRAWLLTTGADAPSGVARLRAAAVVREVGLG